MIKICKIAAFLYFSLLHAATPDELYLVVGSTKEPGQLNNPYLRSYHHNSAADFTHEHTFGGRAITMDLRIEKKVLERHISETDICSFSPEKLIDAVFMELFPSHGVRTVMDLQRMAAAQDSEFIAQLENEFTAKLSNAPKLVIDSFIEHIRKELSEPYKTDAMLMPRAIQNLAKYMKVGANLYMEHIPLMAGQPTVNPFSLRLCPSLFLEELRAALSEPSSTSLRRQAVDLVQAAMENSTGEIRLYREEYFAVLTAEVDACVTPEAFHQSLSLVVLLELERLEQSQPESPINKFLSKQGFTNITHERVTNTFNGRNNSWMISAVKT